jgi:putative ABC transport system permease protein
MDVSLWSERVLALSAAFRTIAAVMANVGVFGALAYVIAQSKREIGIGVALGAPPTKLVRMQALKPLIYTAIAVAAGVLAFFALAAGIRRRPVRCCGP